MTHLAGVISARPDRERFYHGGRVCRCRCLSLPRLHHVGPQDVLPSAEDYGPFMRELVNEHQGHAGRRADRRLLEPGLASLEVVVQVDHERQPAALAIGPLEVPIAMPAERLAGLVAIEPKPLVHAART